MNKDQVKSWMKGTKESIKNIISEAFGNGGLLRKINFRRRNGKIEKIFPQLCLPKPIVVMADEA